MYRESKELPSTSTIPKHPCLKVWRVRVDKAEKRRHFTPSDKYHAAVWNGCAIHEASSLVPIEMTTASSGRPTDPELYTLGTNFSIAVTNEDFARCREISNQHRNLPEFQMNDAEFQAKLVCALTWAGIWRREQCGNMAAWIPPEGARTRAMCRLCGWSTINNPEHPLRSLPVHVPPLPELTDELAMKLWRAAARLCPPHKIWHECLQACIRFQEAGDPAYAIVLAINSLLDEGY